MTDIVTAIYELMGEREDGGTDDVQIKNKVDIIFQVGLRVEIINYLTPLKFCLCLENGPESRRSNNDRRISGLLSEG